MIERRHEVGLKPEHAYIAGFASIGLSFLAWATSLKADKAETDRADRWGSSWATGGLRSSARATRCAALKAVTPGRAAAGITRIRAGSPDRRPATRPITERSRMGVGMAAVKRMAAVAMMAGLLTGPVAAPNRGPDRPRRGSYSWHVFMDWLGYRRAVRRGSGGTNGQRRNTVR